MSVYEIGPFHLKAERLSLAHNGTSLSLGPKVVETLLALAEHPGEVLTKEWLLDRVWPEGFVEESSLAQNIYVLRKAFRAFGAADPIETVPRSGYRLREPARLLIPARRPTHSGNGALSRRIAAAFAGVAFITASAILVGSQSLDQRHVRGAALSEQGSRLYLVGRYYWNLRTRDGVQKSLRYFNDVIDSDPQNALGYAALADANVTMGDYCYGTHRPQVYFARAREYARKALELDADSAQAHAALGFIALHGANGGFAMSELRRALELDPAYGPAHEWYGIALMRRGNSSAGLVQLNAAADLDPLSVATTAWLGSAAYVDGRFADAIAYSREALELAPQRTDALATIGKAYEAQGRIDRAIEAFKRFGSVNSYYRPQAAAFLAQAYAIDHQMNEARSQLAYASAHSADVNVVQLLDAAASIGERGAALSVLRRFPGHDTSNALENATPRSVRK